MLTAGTSWTVQLEGGLAPLRTPRRAFRLEGPQTVFDEAVRLSGCSQSFKSYHHVGGFAMAAQNPPQADDPQDCLAPPAITDSAWCARENQ